MDEARPNFFFVLKPFARGSFRNHSCSRISCSTVLESGNLNIVLTSESLTTWTTHAGIICVQSCWHRIYPTFPALGFLQAMPASRFYVCTAKLFACFVLVIVCQTWNFPFFRRGGLCSNANGFGFGFQPGPRIQSRNDQYIGPISCSGLFNLQRTEHNAAFLPRLIMWCKLHACCKVV